MITPEMVTKAAKAMDENFNPDRYPILATMNLDYAEVALSAVYDDIRAQARAEAFEEAAQALDCVPDEWYPERTFSEEYREGFRHAVEWVRFHADHPELIETREVTP